MSLTRYPGPLAGRTPHASYLIEGPAHRLLMHDFPRRIRGVFGGETVIDTVRGSLLHETGLNVVLYVPFDDVRRDLLTPTDHSTHCPYKGDASYWSLQAGDRTANNAFWAYERPIETAGWLRGLTATSWATMDAWYDEDEEVVGGLPDPFHRVDIRPSSRHVKVTVDGEVVAESRRPMLLSETGLPNRFYLAPEEVRRELLVPSGTRTVCPYKGTASYWSLRIGNRELRDAVWSYQEPLDGSARIAGRLSFAHDDLLVETV